MTSELVKQAVDTAQQLGGFSSAAVWAFFCLIFLAYIFLDMRNKNADTTKTVAAKLDQAKADMMVANAIDKMANEIKDLRNTIENGGNHAGLVQKAE